MSASRVVVLRCDALACGFVYTSGRLTVGAARHDAAQLGWQSEADGDVCPEHAFVRRYRVADLDVIYAPEGRRHVGTLMEGGRPVAEVHAPDDDPPCPCCVAGHGLDGASIVHHRHDICQHPCCPDWDHDGA